jgi:hypothetical protein
VFLIELENENYASTWGAQSPAKYLNSTLVPQGVLLSQYYAIGHFSLDNYIAEISGQAPNPETQADCLTYTNFAQTGTSDFGQAKGKGCVYPASVKTIADQLSAAKLTWKEYAEDMGSPCRHPQIGQPDPNVVETSEGAYATRHNPFVYFHSITDSPACAQDVVDFSKLAPDLASTATTPNFSFITPNLCHDGHDAPCKSGEPGGLTSSDKFLSQVVPKIMASPAYKQDGMILVVFDESENDASACCNTPPSPNAPHPGGSGPGGGRTGALVISPHARAGTTDTTPYNHYSLLCSLENAFELDHLGFAGVPNLRCFGSDVYKPS